MAHIYADNAPWVEPQACAESMVDFLQRKNPEYEYTIQMQEIDVMIGGIAGVYHAIIYKKAPGLFARSKYAARATHTSTMGNGPGTIALDSKSDLAECDLEAVLENARSWSAHTGIHRTDLHMHGPIGFQPYWLEKQSYRNTNVLQQLFNEAVSKKITLCAVTSQEDEIPRGSIHDRLGWLREHEASRLPAIYQTDTLSENILIVEKGDDKVYFLNGQTVNVVEQGERYDHLVLGSNQVQNGKNLKDTLAYGKDHGLIQIAEHPFLSQHRGIGDTRLLENLEDFDAIEGFNAQARLSPGVNAQAKTFAAAYHKPWIAVSDAHRIEDLGISYIEFPDTLDLRSEDALLSSLKDVLRKNHFRRHEEYVSLNALRSWMMTFQVGINLRQGRLARESAV